MLEQNLGWQNRILFNALASRSLDIFNHPQPSSTNSNLPYLAALQAQEAWFWRNQSLDRWERKDARVCAFLLVLCKQPGLMKSMLMTYAADSSVNIPSVGKPTWLWAPWTCCLRTLSTALVSIGTPIVKIQSNWNAKSINGPYTRKYRTRRWRKFQK